MLNVAKGTGAVIVTALLLFAAVWGSCYYFFPKARVALVIGMVVLVIVGPMLTRSRGGGVPYLDTAIVIDGVRVKGPVEKWDNGKLRIGILEGDQTIQGWPAASGGVVSFDESGELISWRTAPEVEIWGRKIPAGSEVLGTPSTASSINVIPREGNNFEIHRPR